MTATQTKTKTDVSKYWKYQKQISLPEKGTIVSMKKYYRFKKRYYHASSKLNEIVEAFNHVVNTLKNKQE